MSERLLPDDLAPVRAALESAAVAVAGRLAEADAARVALQEHEARCVWLSGELAEARQQVQRGEAELADAVRRAEVAEADTARVAAHFEDALDELRSQHADTVRAQAVECASLPLDGLLTAFNAFAKARTPGAVVATLRSGLLREFSRVGVFRLRGEQLEGEAPTGGDSLTGIGPVVIPLTVDCLPVRAMTTRRIQSSVGDDLPVLPGLPLGSSACAVALPIAVYGEAPAVIYADISDPPEYAPVTPHLLVKYAELLLRHASLVALRIAVEQRTGTASRDTGS